jgi:hypothetical protein
MTFLGAGLFQRPSRAQAVAALAATRREVASCRARGESAGQWLAAEVHHRGIRENAAVLAVLVIPKVSMMMECALVPHLPGALRAEDAGFALVCDLADGLRELERGAQWQQVVGAWYQDFPAVAELRRDRAAGLRHHGVFKVAEEHDRRDADLANPGEARRVCLFQVSDLEPR